jgi:hypothetical protein
MEQASLPMIWYLACEGLGDPSTLPEDVLQELKAVWPSLGEMDFRMIEHVTG